MIPRPLSAALLATLALSTAPALAQDTTPPAPGAPAGSTASSPPPSRAAQPAPWYRFRAVAEFGFLAVLSHKAQFSQNGNYFDYVKEGGQDNLYAVSRFSVEAELFRRHTVIFLYQPLDIATSVLLPNDLRVDGATFPAGTPMDLRYGFPFYRGSYLYDLVEDPRNELSIGLGLQIRNATIEFASKDGTLFRSNRNIGPVPLLKSRGRLGLPRGAFIGYEVDGLYAPISILNGSDNEVTGAIVDLSLRGGLALPLNSEAFLNVRYIGGGSTGQGAPEPPSDGYTKNWLHFLTVSLGASISTF
jgi:hypothetical protein